MTLTPAERFSETAPAYAATMAPSLRPIAAEVVRRAELRRGEKVIDIGTGTGHAAAMAGGDGREVHGIDAARGMLEIARSEVPEVDFREMDFAALEYPDASFDAVISVHALLFATDQVAALREWGRVTAPGGRLSLSVPGPDAFTPTEIYADIYARYGIDTTGRYPSSGSLATLAAEAGWAEIKIDEDSRTAIILDDEAAFRTWRQIGSRGPATMDFTPERHQALTDEMLAVTPRDAEGRFRIPFGALYLTARKPR